jgi:hypothetical protein
MWSLSNAFTSAFKELDPIPQFRATAKAIAHLALPGAVNTQAIDPLTAPLNVITFGVAGLRR